jgi:ATP-dependent Lhr-like helicase
MIEKRHPRQEKTGRQVTVSTDLVYDVLRKYEPDHILLQATWADAATGLLDIGRLGDMLARIKGRIIHRRLDYISPLAIPVLLEIGRERVPGAGADDHVLREAADDLVREAYGYDAGGDAADGVGVPDGRSAAHGRGRARPDRRLRRSS